MISDTLLFKRPLGFRRESRALKSKLHRRLGQDSIQAVYLSVDVKIISNYEMAELPQERPKTRDR